MEYIFGTILRHKRSVDILKTVGAEHTNISGSHEVVREYPDCTITDSFVVVNKYLSKEDSEGNCYDWYEIDRHYRYADYFTPQKVEIDTAISETQTGLMEAYDLTAETAADMSDVREALEEIYEMIIGGDE